MSRIFTIAKNTFREAVRDRIFIIAAVFAFFFIGFSLFIGSISLDEDARIITNMGLAAIFSLQLFVAIFVGAQLVFKEVERRTFFLVLPKAVTRSQVLWGKFFGLAATVAYVTALAMAVFFAVFAFKIHSLQLIPGLLIAIALGYAEALVVISISLLFSSLTSPTLSIFYTLAIVFIGHSSGLLLGVIEKQSNVFVKYALWAAYYAFPNLEKFNIRNDVTYGVFPAPMVLVAALLYGIAYGWFAIIAARIIFERREF
ncbi:MAG: ABC transporter permease subunit [bacterium]|nr:ABC transporter permease subunit [bacterium]